MAAKFEYRITTNGDKSDPQYRIECRSVESGFNVGIVGISDWRPFGGVSSSLSDTQEFLRMLRKSEKDLHRNWTTVEETMSDGEKSCDGCKYLFKDFIGPRYKGADMTAYQLLCRRFPPQALSTTAEIYAVWPPVIGRCGEYTDGKEADHGRDGE